MSGTVTEFKLRRACMYAFVSNKSTRNERYRSVRLRTHLPPGHVPSPAPSPPRPSFTVMQPPPGAEQLRKTHILKRTLWQFPVPLVLYLDDFLRRFVVEDVDVTVDGRFFLYALKHVTGAHGHLNWISCRYDFMLKTLDLREDGLQAVPL